MYSCLIWNVCFLLSEKAALNAFFGVALRANLTLLHHRLTSTEMSTETTESSPGYEVYEWALGHPTAQLYAEVLRANMVTNKSLHRADIVQDLIDIRDKDGRQAIPTIIAKDIVAEFRSSTHFGEVAVFWDIENVRPPSGVLVNDAAAAIIKGLQSKHGNVVEAKVYLDLSPPVSKNPSQSKSPLTPNERVGLQDLKVEVVDAFHNGRKEVADKMIIVDAMWFALNYQRVHGTKPIICIVSGDSDFSPLVSKLSMNGFHSICIHHSSKVRSLHKAAGQSYTWDHFNIGVSKSPAVDVSPTGAAPAGAPCARAAPGAALACVEPAPVESKMNQRDNQMVLDLLEAVRECEQRTGDEQVLRSQAGLRFQRKTISGSFKEAVEIAYTRGLLEKGGDGGTAWIRIKKLPLFLIVSKNGPLDMKFIKEQATFAALGIECESKNISVLGGGTVTRAVFGPFDTEEEIDEIVMRYRDALGLHEMWVSEDKDDFICIDVGGTMMPYTRFALTKGLTSFLLNGVKTAQVCRHIQCIRGADCSFIHLK